MRSSALCLCLVLAACAKQYLPPDSGPTAKLGIVATEPRGTVGYMTPQECRKRLGAHAITDLAALTPTLETQLPAGQDAVLAYDYDQPAHLGPVDQIVHCHIAFAFHPDEGRSYTLLVAGPRECRLELKDGRGQPVPGVSFAADRCNTYPSAFLPGSTLQGP